MPSIEQPPAAPAPNAPHSAPGAGPADAQPQSTDGPRRAGVARVALGLAVNGGIGVGSITLNGIRGAMSMANWARKNPGKLAKNAAIGTAATAAIGGAALLYRGVPIATHDLVGQAGFSMETTYQHGRGNEADQFRLLGTNNNMRVPMLQEQLFIVEEDGGHTPFRVPGITLGTIEHATGANAERLALLHNGRPVFESMQNQTRDGFFQPTRTTHQDIYLGDAPPIGAVLENESGYGLGPIALSWTDQERLLCVPQNGSAPLLMQEVARVDEHVGAVFGESTRRGTTIRERATGPNCEPGGVENVIETQRPFRGVFNRVWATGSTVLLNGQRAYTVERITNTSLTNGTGLLNGFRIMSAVDGSEIGRLEMVQPRWTHEDLQMRFVVRGREVGQVVLGQSEEPVTQDGTQVATNRHTELYGTVAGSNRAERLHSLEQMDQLQKLLIDENNLNYLNMGQVEELIDMLRAAIMAGRSDLSQNQLLEIAHSMVSEEDPVGVTRAIQNLVFNGEPLPERFRARASE